MIGKASLVTGLTAWLYYRTAWAFIFLSPMWFWYYRQLSEECVRRKQQEFEQQFKEMIRAAASSLNAGYSVENALRESRKELRLLYSEKEPILRELGIVERQLRIQVPAEQAMEEMAERVCLEDVENFAAVFATAKRSGGDMMAIIRNTSEQIGDKTDVRREIQTILAAKRYEFKVMAGVPYLIIAYMSVSFPEFMGCLYGNVIGIGVMTVCLVMYLGAYYLGVKLVEIEV